MNDTTDNKPVILVLAGHDPTGAAGIQADMESIHANGGRCISVITTLTAQNTTHFAEMIPQDPDNFRKQADLLLADIPVRACKIGLIGSPELIGVIADLVKTLGDIPMVVDPILQAGTGGSLSTPGMIDALLTRLIPSATLLTPNLHEARRLTGEKNPAEAADKLLNNGCSHVLVTDTRPETKTVSNILYSPRQEPVVMEWERLPGTYHGSGCTLSSALAACLAQGMTIQTATAKAQTFTWQSLERAEKIGHGQFHPRRLV
jgi:hydroxymethylpyrimidine/phosphomethylpyrimidine kinase